MLLVRNRFGGWPLHVMRKDEATVVPLVRGGGGLRGMEEWMVERSEGDPGRWPKSVDLEAA